METRIALSGDLQSLIDEVRQSSSDDLDMLMAIEERINAIRIQNQEAGTSPVSGAPPESSASPLSTDQTVRFRIEIHSASGLPVETVDASESYFANVFVRDVRNPGDTSSYARGVFQAIVDLDFGDNAQPIGEPMFSATFPSLQKTGEMVGNTLRGIGAVSGVVNNIESEDQFLLAIPFVVDNPNRPTLLTVSPSRSIPESVLLFGLNASVPAENVGAGTVNLQGIPIVTLPPQPQVATPASPAQSRPTGDAPPDNTPSDNLDRPFIASLLVNPFALTLVSSQSADALHRLDGSAEIYRWFETEDDNEEVELLELPFAPDTATKRADTAGGGPEGTESEDADDEEERDERADLDGLFFDERLFIEGALIGPSLSSFRLRFQNYTDSASTDGDDLSTTNAGDASEMRHDELVDIALVLRDQDSPRVRGPVVVGAADRDTRQPSDAASIVEHDFAMSFEIDPMNFSADKQQAGTTNEGTIPPSPKAESTKN